MLACALVLMPTTRGASQEIDGDCVAYPLFDHYEAACDGLKPRWIARASALFMIRKRENSLVLFQNTANVAEQINADDFDFDYSVGFDLSLMRKTWDDNGFEIRYLDLGQLDAVATATSAAEIWSINSMPPVFAPDVQAVQASYDSDLFSVEANYHYWIYEGITLLGGLRYVSLNDDLTEILDAAPQTFTYDTSTRNDLYGAQVGINGAPDEPIFGCLVPAAFAKVGVFGNDARQRSLLDTGAASLAVHDSASRVAWVGELGISTELQLSRYVSILGGYSMLWLDNVAIGSDQVVVNDFFNSVGIDNRGSAIFYGANLGIGLQL